MQFLTLASVLWPVWRRRFFGFFQETLQISGQRIPRSCGQSKVVPDGRRCLQRRIGKMHQECVGNSC
ncbi:hypothetical protein L596_017262 [Steinernema carpocapsae]|uniref:Uncharacterized protein n=1 Tax=Steinernema carpocapsae TaxID=34508 RepID=A0A4U5N1B4_STECR|nr:hypothetical protein L596_017262 [Steinernema carpocapsae]